MRDTNAKANANANATANDNANAKKKKNYNKDIHCQPIASICLATIRVLHSVVGYMRTIPNPQSRHVHKSLDFLISNFTAHRKVREKEEAEDEEKEKGGRLYAGNKCLKFQVH